MRSLPGWAIRSRDIFVLARKLGRAWSLKSFWGNWRGGDKNR